VCSSDLNDDLESKEMEGEKDNDAFEQKKRGRT
jgi:hypothetical protein